MRPWARTARGAWATLGLLAPLAALAAPAGRADGPATWALPEDRRMDWKPGVPGGIPSYPVFASVKAAPYGAKGDGKADDTAAIQRALDDCPEGKAVKVPAGTYRLTTEIRIGTGVVLRGDGPEKTRLVNEAVTKHAISLCHYDEEAASRVVGDASKGATRVKVEDGSRFSPGDLLLVDQKNDPNLVEITGEGGVCRWAGREDGRRAMGQLAELVSRNGDVLTLNRPLAITFRASLGPEIVRTSKQVTRRAGVEDLYLETTRPRTDDSSSIKFWNAIHCWVRNVESSRGWSYGHVTLKRSLGCEVRDSFFHHAHAYGSGHGYAVLVTAQSTDTLVENNACYHLNTGPQAASCGPGNVFAYNFSWRTFGRDYPRTEWAHPDLSHHAAHPFLTLWEGNWAGQAGFDFYWGSSSHNTLFRNVLDMRSRRTDGKPMTRNVVAVRIDRFGRYDSAVGNVLGHEGMEGEVEAREGDAFHTPALWSLGHPGDPLVGETLLRHGNYDYLRRATQWDPKIPERKLPDSLYLAGKPAFFGSLSWPPIGPDRRPISGSIPARERFLAIPAADLDARDLLYLGEFHMAAGRKDEARAALSDVVSKYASSSWARAARADLESLK